jgi:hypothetical protein
MIVYPLNSLFGKTWTNPETNYRRSLSGRAIAIFYFITGA